ncbi:MAG: hypothetical protein V4555_05585 [Acidobacteriota bacterium]
MSVPQPIPKSARQHLRIIAVVFVLTRLFAHLNGVRFAAERLFVDWQFLDPTLLQHHLFQSLLYLHTQPPLMNLFFGLCLKLTPNHWPTLAHAIYCTLGLLAWLALYTVAVRNRVPHRFALLFTLVALCNPSAILFESEPLYTNVVFCLLLFAAFFFDRFLRTRSPNDATALLALLTTLVLSRASFQLLWFLVIACCILKLTPRQNLRRTVTVAILCTAFITSVYAKNYILFRSFNTSSWMGMNLAKGFSETDRDPDIQRLLAEGKLPPIWAVHTFSDISAYSALVPPPPPTGAPAADALTFTNGENNFNNTAYVSISKAYLGGYLKLWRYSPHTVVLKWIKAWKDYFLPTSQWSALLDPDNEQRLETADRRYRALFCCSLEPLNPLKRPGEVLTHHTTKQILLSLCWPAVLVTLLALALLLYPPLLRWSASNDTQRRTLLLFLTLNFLFTAALGNSVEIGENMRFRYEAQGLALLIACIVLGRILNALQARRA